MTIVTLSDALIQRLASTDRRILRDRVLSGFCLRLNKRTRTFLVATTAGSQQVRITIGRWPLMTTAEARMAAIEVLRKCRNGDLPAKPKRHSVPTLRQVLPQYAAAKKIKPSSVARYESILKVHFGNWQDCSLQELASDAFAQHCHEFVQTKGPAVVEVGRGLIGAIVRYANAVYGLQLNSPFAKLAAAGLMPDRVQARERRLQENDLAEWHAAVQKLPAKQRDLLLLIAMTGLRRNEAGTIRMQQIDFEIGILHIPETKTGQPHALPITPILLDILQRRSAGLEQGQLLFEAVSLDHLAEMATRAGAPSFMLHDLRKLLATTGEHLGFSDAVVRRILNHKAKRSDTLHRHYISLTASDIREPLSSIQACLMKKMRKIELGP